MDDGMQNYKHQTGLCVIQRFPQERNQSYLLNPESEIAFIINPFPGARQLSQIH